MKYKKAGMGGTFDRFHVGHQQFIEFASQTADHLLIGITKPHLLTKKLFAESIEPFEVRKKSVIDFCDRLKISYEVVALSDIYGPTLSDSAIDVLIATENTAKGAEAINFERVKRGLSTLSIEKASLSYDKDNLVISSERIRAGEINRDGVIYAKVLQQDLVLTDKQRDFFGQPQGDIVTSPSESVFCCLVGDTTVETFLENNWKYDLACFDYLKKRADYSPHIIDDTRTDLCAWNEPGSISKTMTVALSQAISQKSSQLFIKGEEDLAAVAAVLLLPLNSHIYYGQPDLGMVEIRVTEEKKEEVFAVLNPNLSQSSII